MKTLVSGTLVVLCLGAVTARASLDLGDGSALFVTGTLSGAYDDNIFLRSNNAKSDYLTTFSPGLELKYGQSALSQGLLAFNEDFNWYSSNSSQNSSLAHFNFLNNYDDGKTKSTLRASFDQLAQNNYNVRTFGQLVRRDLTNGFGRVEFRATEKSSLAIGAQYNKTDYKTAGFVTTEDFSIPVDYYYAIEPKLDLSVEYRYRRTTVAGSYPNSDDNFVGIGARGELAPKLSGEFHVGYTSRSFSHGSSQSLPGVNANFTYQYSPKTTATLDLSNDFTYAGTGSSQKTFSTVLGVVTEFQPGLSGSVSVAYRDMNYLSGERDHYWESTIGATQAYNKYVSVTAGYTHRKNNSNLPVGFADNVFTLSASLRY